MRGSGVRIPLAAPLSLCPVLHLSGETLLEVTGLDDCRGSDGYPPLPRQQGCFILFRRPVAERRVQPLAIIDGFDKGADAAAGCIEVCIGAAVDFLLLERSHEALGL